MVTNPLVAKVQNASGTLLKKQHLVLFVVCTLMQDNCGKIMALL